MTCKNSRSRAVPHLSLVHGRFDADDHVVDIVDMLYGLWQLAQEKDDHHDN